MVCFARRRRAAVVALLALALGPAACDAAGEDSKAARASAEKAVVDARAGLASAQGKLDDASAAARDALVSAKGTLEGARASPERSVAVARAWATDLKDTGELSATARSWVSAADSGAIESWVASGTQVMPVAAAIALTLLAAVDSDTVLEPVYQPIEDGRVINGKTGDEAVDAAIEQMGRVEVIDGLSIGFNQLSATSTKTRVTESGYLVLWRHEGHLIGFVYRSRKTVDIDLLRNANGMKTVAITDNAVPENLAGASVETVHGPARHDHGNAVFHA
jgi:hypothetical protein